MTELPELTEIDAAARQLGLAATPSELHGTLCGWLAGGGEDAPGWLPRALTDDALPALPPEHPLERLRQASSHQLLDRDFAFELLLPPAEDGLDGRAEALFDWCRGFLGAFGLAAGARPGLSEEGEEALRDLARLAQASPEIGADAEEDEAALAELEEFVRVAALLLHGDCVLARRHRQSLN
ncbi:YecA family protein [Pseudoxanthomonas kalamensis DSM 18571]|uniref:UPF0149 family protein n=1 Tax=Pseudoxanthomonas kalamensis TaxID=289483 RepID=UPI0013919026|nr:UPF0149 family protein [Pseudoxanthomonas kalamensis]KAF1712635.1 YecA family protein [Pseudoxanthomonas kalamensis DSM 18571]